MIRFNLIRFKRFIAVMVITGLAVSLVSCGKPEKKRYEAQFTGVFDTVTQIVAYSESKEEFTNQSQYIYDMLKEYHQLYDIYNDYPGINNLKTVNDNAGIKPVKVDKKIIDLLLFAKKWYKETDGKLNVALGAVLKIWHNHREAGIEDEAGATLPDIEELREANKHVDIDKVIIDEENSTVFLEDPKMSLDVGGVGKGFATEQVCLKAKENGFDSGLISVGGNVRAIGSKGTEEDFWNVGVQNPDKESNEKILRITYLKDMSLVSSGIYERYYIVDGKQYHHIIDPDTLFPADNYSQVTILCKDSGVADAVAKAAFILPFDRALEYVNALQDIEAMWVFNDGSIKYSSGFEKYMKK